MLDIPTFLNVLGTVVVLMLPVAAVLWAAWRTVADWMADPPVDSGSVDEVDDTPAGRHSPDQRRSRNRRGGVWTDAVRVNRREFTADSRQARVYSRG